MKTLEQNNKLLYASKQEQVDASVRFVLEDLPEYYLSLGNLPNRVQAAIMTMVVDWKEVSGYHFNVLRVAQTQYSRGSGFIAVDEPPFTDKELYN